MSVRASHRFSVTEYHRMGETGVLEPEARVELLNGRIIDMSPIGPWHGGLVKRLIRILSFHSRGRWIVSAQDPIRLDEQSEPQPDVMLLKPVPDDYTTRHPQPADVFLLIEVSDTTLEYDREEKLAAYGRAGIAEVWIVNLIEETIEVYGEPHFTGYGTKTIFRAGGKVSPGAFSDLVLDVSELLKK